jgi:hypothetical protein
MMLMCDIIANGPECLVPRLRIDGPSIHQHCGTRCLLLTPNARWRVSCVGSKVVAAEKFLDGINKVRRDP